MPGISVSKICIPFGGGVSPIDWSTYWSTLISATVENAAPTHVVLTFPAEGTSTATDITATVNGVARTVSSASWVGSVWTVVFASAVTYGDVVVMTFVPSGGTANVTNNVAAEAEYLAVYNAFAVKPATAIAREQNRLVKTLVDAGTWTKLDCVYVFAGSSRADAYRNWVQNLYHCTDNGTAVEFTEYLGVRSATTGRWLNSNYNPFAQDKKYKVADASMGIYSLTNSGVDLADIGRARNFIALHYSSSNVDNVRVSTVGGGAGNPPATISNIFKIVSRLGSITKIYDNGINTNSFSNADAVVDNSPFGILTSDNYNITNRTVPFAFFGSSLTYDDVYALVSAIKTYLDSLGIGVIDYVYQPKDFSASNICGIGDSITADYTYPNFKIAKYFKYLTDNTTAQPGNTIAQQKIAFLALAAGVRDVLDYTFIQSGLTLLGDATTAAAIIIQLQDLVDTVIANSGANNKIVLATLTPVKPTLDETQHVKLLAINDAIMNRGATPITGVDYRTEAHTIELMETDGTLKTIYLSSGVHPNARGRYEIAKSWYNAVNV